MDCFKDLINSSNLQFQTCHFWSDNGTPFRSGCFQHLLLSDSSFAQSTNFTISYFVPGHSKSPCDQFFGTLKRKLRKEVLKKDINDIDDLKEILKKLGKNIN